ncbi:hypothetical protein, partial [Klebsiella pneumoniae]|uniref:hypothetical protein n=1 Tax=Klebsiella pneumoniae TaxID=573 RepID=UPI0024DE75F7
DRKKVESGQSARGKQRERVRRTIDLGEIPAPNRLAQEGAGSQIEKTRDESEDFWAKFVKASEECM